MAGVVRNHFGALQGELLETSENRTPVQDQALFVPVRLPLSPEARLFTVPPLPPTGTSPPCGVAPSSTPCAVACSAENLETQASASWAAPSTRVVLRGPVSALRLFPSRSLLPSPCGPSRLLFLPFLSVPSDPSWPLAHTQRLQTPSCCPLGRCGALSRKQSLCPALM